MPSESFVNIKEGILGVMGNSSLSLDPDAPEGRCRYPALKEILEIQAGRKPGPDCQRGLLKVVQRTFYTGRETQVFGLLTFWACSLGLFLSSLSSLVLEVRALASLLTGGQWEPEAQMLANQI